MRSPYPPESRIEEPRTTAAGLVASVALFALLLGALLFPVAIAVAVGVALVAAVGVVVARRAPAFLVALRAGRTVPDPDPREEV
jgi:uncharacterized membrane protein